MDGQGKGGGSFQSATSECGDVVKCCCKYKAVIRISGSVSNPGRLYFGCPKFKVSERCGFFRWYDNDFEDKVRCHEASSSITIANSRNGVQHSLTNLEVKVAGMEKQMKRVKYLVMGLYGVIVCVVILLVGLLFKEDDKGYDVLARM